MAGIGDNVKAGIEDLKKAPAPLIIGVLVTAIVNAIPLVNFIGGALVVGLYFTILKVKKGETVAVGDVFSKFDMDSIMIGVPAAAIGLVSLINQFVIGSVALGGLISLLSLAVGVALVWAAPIRAARNVPFMDAFTGSVSFWGKEPVGNLITLVVAFVLMVVGLIACLVGALVTAPIAMSVILAHYLDKSGTPASSPSGAAV